MGRKDAGRNPGMDPGSGMGAGPGMGPGMGAGPGMDPRRYEEETSAKAAVAGQLAPGEHVLWAGRSASGARFGPGDAFLIPFALFWTAFAVFWTVMASSGAGVFGLFGVPFILVGLFLLFGRFLPGRRLRAVYALTDRRVIALRLHRDGSRKTIQERTLAGLPSASLQVRRNGVGTIAFGPVAAVYRGPGSYERTWGTPLGGATGFGYGDGVAFVDIPDCNRVYDLYVEAKARAEAAAAAAAVAAAAGSGASGA